MLLYSNRVQNIVHGGWSFAFPDSIKDTSRLASSCSRPISKRAKCQRRRCLHACTMHSPHPCLPAPCPSPPTNPPTQPNPPSNTCAEPLTGIRQSHESQSSGVANNYLLHLHQPGSGRLVGHPVAAAHRAPAPWLNRRYPSQPASQPALPNLTDMARKWPDHVVIRSVRSFVPREERECRAVPRGCVCRYRIQLRMALFGRAKWWAKFLLAGVNTL